VEPVAMVAEAMATHPAAAVNLGGRLPLIDASLFPFRYIFDSGTIHRSGTKASTDIFRLLSVDTNSFSSVLAAFVILGICTTFLGFLVFAAHIFDFLVAANYTISAGSQPSSALQRAGLDRVSSTIETAYE